MTTHKGLDLTSPTWQAIAAHAAQQLATLRERNDSPTLDAPRTAEVRGRIAAWKELLTLANQPAPVQPADVGTMGY